MRNKNTSYRPQNKRAIFVILLVWGIILIVAMIYTTVKEMLIGDKNLLYICGNWAQVFVGFSVFVAYKQMMGDHERSRRENALDAIRSWNLMQTMEMMVVRKNVEKLDENCCRKLFAYESFEVDEDMYNDIMCLFHKDEDLNTSENETVCVDKDILNCKKCKLKEKKLPQPVIYEMRYLMIKYLNELESIFEGWKSGIYDEEIIFEQFEFIINQTEGKDILQSFRIAAGGEKSFPAIEAFRLTMMEKRNQQIKNKNLIG